MKQALLAWLLIGSLTLAAPVPLAVKLGQPFALDCCGNGPPVARYAPARLSIEFLRVKSDSRCPPGVNCIWAGSAALELRVSIGTLKKTLTLNTGLEPRSARVFGYTLRVKDLLPANDERANKPYRATLVLEKQ